MEERKAVAYCGLCCLDCQGHLGKIPDLARDLRKELKRSKYEKFAASVSKYPFAAALRHYPECYDVLGLMMKFRCRKGCRDGGGPPFCNIRKCCKDKAIDGCWECADFVSCKKLDFLTDVHGDAARKNLMILKKNGITAFLAGKRSW